MQQTELCDRITGATAKETKDQKKRMVLFGSFREFRFCRGSQLRSARVDKTVRSLFPDSTASRPATPVDVSHDRGLRCRGKSRSRFFLFFVSVSFLQFCIYRKQIDAVARLIQSETNEVHSIRRDAAGAVWQQD